MSKPWLLTWLALMAVVVLVAVISILRSGLPGLAVAGPIVAFAGSIPAWFPRVFPDTAVPSPLLPDPGRSTTAGPEVQAPSSAVAHAEPDTERSPSLYDSPVASKGVEGHRDGAQGHREPGSTEFSDLVYALATALPDQARVIRVMDLAGLDRGIIEDGFVDASTRWHVALRHAVESGTEEALCREALRASPSRRLRAAIAAYLAR